MIRFCNTLYEVAFKIITRRQGENDGRHTKQYVEGVRDEANFSYV